MTRAADKGAEISREAAIAALQACAGRIVAAAEALGISEARLRRLASSDAGVAAVVSTLRGFQLLSPERRREIAVRGGQASQAVGTGHAYTHETGKHFGHLGGQAAARAREQRRRAAESDAR